MEARVRPETPVRIVVDVTRRCNLTCYYCHSSSGPHYRGPAIAGDRMPEILDAADRLKVFEVTITGGEPLLWDGWPDLATAARNLTYTSLQLITNATIVTDRALRMLDKVGLTRICVSLDGPPDTHDIIRGRGRFAKTVAGIARLRSICDNITVISVLDRNNYRYWAELTPMLVDLGVRQHHLTPVCFAGDAMRIYEDKALRESEFSDIVAQLSEVTPNLPDGFILSFKDGLLRPIEERSFTLSGFTCEYFKGHHLVIQPDGKVQRAARGWGRTWRADECIGNINEMTLSEIISNEQPTVVPLDFEQEMQRKYHLMDVTRGTVEADLAAVTSVREGGLGDLSEPEKIDWSRIHPVSILGMVPLPQLSSLVQSYAQEPGRYRMRSEADVSLLFDRRNFEIHVLSPEEAATLTAAGISCAT